MDKRAVVIGAAGGIGVSCVRRLTSHGWDVIAADLQQPDIAEAAQTHALDVRDFDSVREFAEGVGTVGAVIYAAGTVATMPIHETDFAIWRRVLAVNLDGAAHVAAAFSNIMIKSQTQGSFVFLSSAAGVRGESGASAYSASKAGLIGLIESMAAELTLYGIRVNGVAPGNVDTPMLRKVAREIALNTGQSEAEVWDSFARTGAAQRLVSPEEVASVCAALADPSFSAVTGAIVPVDAGYLLS